MLPNIKKNSKIFFFLFFLTCIGVFSTAASQNPEFDIAIKLYENLQFKEALIKFENISLNGDENSKQLAALFYAKTLFKLRRFAEASEYLGKLVKSELKKQYNDEAKLTLAQAYMEQNNYIKAFNILLLLNDKTEDDYYKKYSETSAIKIGENLINSSELEKILSDGISERQKPLVKLLLGKAYIKENKYEDAGVEFLEIVQNYPKSPVKGEANKLYINAVELSKEKGINPPSSVIGVILPLSNNKGSSAAAEILEGIKYAIDEFNSEREDKTGLIIRDTEFKKEKISSIREEFSRVQPLKAIIGPIYSGEVRDALKEFKDDKIVLISPTATDNDLTENNGNFFQANPNFTVRGKVMAQYIYFVENKRKMAVLNALEGYGPILASSFITEFEKLGGKIITRETYKSGSFSLESPVSKIASSANLVEGIYIPLSDKMDAPAILSQLDLKGVKLPLYGDQDWLYAKGLETSSELSSQLTFTSDYFIDYNSLDFSEFNDSFFKRTRTEVNRNVLYGYDTAKYLLSILRNFSGSPNAVKQKMESDITINGFHNNICFDEKRINKFLNIIRYREGVFDLVDEFKLN